MIPKNAKKKVVKKRKNKVKRAHSAQQKLNRIVPGVPVQLPVRLIMNH